MVIFCTKDLNRLGPPVKFESDSHTYIHAWLRFESCTSCSVASALATRQASGLCILEKFNDWLISSQAYLFSEKMSHLLHENKVVRYFFTSA